MYKIIRAVFFSCFLIVETRYELTFKSEESQDISVTSSEKKILFRLSEFVRPNSYYIDLKVHLDEIKDKNFTFSGTVKISLNVEKATKNITLHSKYLNIEDLNIAKVPDSLLRPIGVKYNMNETMESYSNVDFLTITAKDSEEFLEGQYDLSITYQGKLSDDLIGFSRSYYVNDKGEKVWLASTKLEPIHARRVFPCFDEPALKATFQLKITHSNTLKAISNTKSIATTDNKDGTMTTEFEKTPLMSTYLFAVVVSDFKSIQTAANNFTVYVRPNAVQFVDLAVKKGEEILKKLEDFTNISFEIGKMDQVAMPQFLSGAMENWGLVTFRENRLLYDEGKSSASEEQKVIQIIAHEFAHQWFGDLVSPKWWQYVWLNEGFASFFSNYITDQVDKSFRSMEQSVVDSIQSTFNMDSRYETYSINMAVEIPVDIFRKFDMIAYRKGMAVIRMMQHYLTDEIFKKGLQKYLNDFHHKAADSDDLFNSIQKVVDEENLNIHVKEVMDTWVNEKGFPIVTVKRNYENNIMILKQERFVTDKNSGEGKINNTWYIPISYATEKNQDFENTSANILFNKAEEAFPVEDLEKNQWIILNKQQTGFYRVNYDEDNWKLIINYLNSPDREKIHPLNRAQLIGDALAFVKQEMLGLHTLVSLITQLKHETDYIPWNAAIPALDCLKTNLRFSQHYPSFKEYGRNLMTALIKSVGFEATDTDDHTKKLSRELLFRLACSLDSEDCIRLSQHKLEAWLKDEQKNIIPEDLKYSIFCYGLRNANFSLWEEVFNKSQSDPPNSEKSFMIEGLGCSNQKVILDRYLNDSLASETCKDMITVIYGILRNSDVGLDAVLDFIVPNIFKFHWKIDKKESLIDLMHEVGRAIKTKEQLAKLKEMEISKILIPNDFITKTVSLAEKNIEWLQKHNEILTSEFKMKNK